MAFLRVSSLCRSSLPPSRLLLQTRSLSLSTPSATNQHPENNNTKQQKKKGFLGMLKEYGLPFTIYWTGVWGCTGVGLYGVMEGLDVNLVSGVEGLLNEHWGKEEPWKFDISPSSGNVAAAVAINEVVEVVRFPFCLMTFKPMYKKYKVWRGIEEKGE